MRRYGEETGHAVVEVALMAPWIFLLFAALFDFGFYAFALISTENAARVAVLQTANTLATTNNATLACPLVLRELQMLPNVGASASCSCSTISSCTIAGSVASVAAASVTTGPDSVAGAPVLASQVTVTYRTVNLFPLPWLPGSLSITRTAEMRATDN
jgi:hypothetical protein